MRHPRLMTITAMIAITVLSGTSADAHLSGYGGPIPPAYPPLPPAVATGAVSMSVAVSPDLPVHPCGAAPVPLNAIGLYLGTQPAPLWASGLYGPCFGDLYAAAAGAVNAGVVSGAGIDMTFPGAGYAFASVGPAAVTADFTYSEPCLDPDGPGGIPPEAITNEAIGWINVTGPATGTYGIFPVFAASVTAKFWSSHVGLAGVVGFDDPIVDLNGVALPAPFASATAAGLAAGVFLPIVPPVCAAPTHTHPNEVLIAVAGAVGGT